ncbi:hypothetical protein IFM89_008146 [Coptis chinensis]|uniref:KIB1-4 beta-propeller domain-containing protein n=1 Tax=Coptis chinensis TaxID=261450 RepID=A0A835IZ48_9MAGN|nr:hypothetical protein IFM89_008146 [Coptis chinensis]
MLDCRLILLNPGGGGDYGKLIVVDLLWKENTDLRPDDQEWSVFGTQTYNRLFSISESKEEEEEGGSREEGEGEGEEEEEEEEEEGGGGGGEEEEEEEEEGGGGGGEEEEEEEEEEGGGSEEEEDPLLLWSFADIIFYEGMLYGLSKMYTLVRFNLENQKPLVAHKMRNMIPTFSLTPNRCTNPRSYLVESCGELLVVYRIRHCFMDMNTLKFVTTKFLVFKLDKYGDAPNWVEVDNLGDQMIFLGRKSAISISAKGVPGFRGNCIYFTDDGFEFFRRSNCRLTCLDNGVFYLEDGHIDSFFPLDSSHSFESQPVWISPNIVLGD